MLKVKLKNANGLSKKQIQIDGDAFGELTRLNGELCPHASPLNRQNIERMGAVASGLARRIFRISTRPWSTPHGDVGGM